MMGLEELGERKVALLEELKKRKARLKERAKEKALKEEIKSLEKALKGPGTLEKIDMALKKGKVKEKGQGFLKSANKFYNKVADFAEKIEPTKAITGTQKTKKRKKVKR